MFWLSMKELVSLILEPYYTCLSVASASHRAEVSVLNMVVRLLGPCEHLVIGAFNFDRISFPFYLIVLA